jgi:hypothetical protein
VAAGADYFQQLGIGLGSDVILRSYFRPDSRAKAVFGAIGRAAMSVSSYLRVWLRLPGRIALMFGIGAISSVSARTGAAPLETGGPSRIPQRSDKVIGELRVWSDGDRIYLAEAGGLERELRLSDTPEAVHLRKLLDDRGAVADNPEILQDRIILVGGGGEGFHWPAAGAAAPDLMRPTVPPGSAGHRTRGNSANPRKPADTGAPGAANRTGGRQAS